MAAKDVSVVLAHGGWADGSSWARVITGLAAAGVKASAAPLPLTSLTDDVAALNRSIERMPGRVVLAAHAEQDRMIVPATQRFMAGRMKAKIKSLAVDHTPIVTAPGPVVDIIRDAVQSVGGK